MAFFGYVFEPADVAIFFTLLLLEGVLSFDNAAVLAAMVRKLPVHQRRKALLYGLAGAYVFRTLAILSVALIIQNPWLKLVGGGYLLYLAVKHLFFDSPHEEHGTPGFLARMGVSGFWGVVLMVELADIAFALDQVLVAVAMTEKTLLIIVASLVAILLLRISASYMTRMMDWFPALEKLAYAAVGWVGLKLVFTEVAHMVGWCGPAFFCTTNKVTGETGFEVPKVMSIGITLSLLVVPVIVKFLYERFRVSKA